MGTQTSYGPNDPVALPAQYEVPVAGFDITPRSSLLILNPAGTLATGTVTLPSDPLDGQRHRVSTTEQITALTVNAATGDSVDDGVPSEMGSDSALELVYVVSESTWFMVTNIATAVPE